MPGERIKQSKFMQRCVADVTGQGKDTSGAFAICTAQSQKAGYAEPGSRKLTGKGKRREKQFAREKDMPDKKSAYLAATGRAEEATGLKGILQHLDERKVAGDGAAVKRTMDEKFLQLSAQIARAVAAGKSLPDAFDAVLGDGRYEKLAAELYDELRKQAGK